MSMVKIIQSAIWSIWIGGIWLKTSFLIERTRLYQVDFQDFSDFGENAFFSSPWQTTSKNITLSPWVTMVTKQQGVENWPKTTKK